MRKNKLIIISCLIILFCLNLSKNIYVFNYKYKTSDMYSKMKCMIIQKEKEDKSRVSYLVKYNSNKFILNIYSDSYNDKDKENIDLSNFSNFNYGDIVELRGKITIPKKMNNPFEFNYKRYLNSNNIVATITTYDVKYVDKVNGNIILKIGDYLRRNLDGIIDEKMEDKEAGLFKSMLYGNGLDLDSNINQTFNEIGISHMLAVSGLHLVFILKILSFITKDMNTKFSIFIYFFIIILFCVISSMSISIIRASIMALISVIYTNTKSSYNEKDTIKKQSKFCKYHKLIVTFIIIVIYNPYVIFNMSFQMSFLSTLGILTYNSLILSYFKVVLKINKKYIWVFEILSLSISASILIFPLQIYYFNKFELMSFISNILLSPIISFEFLLGFLSLFLAFVPFISDIVITSNIIVLKVIITVTVFIQKINYFSIYIPKFNYVEIFFLYLTIFAQTIKKYIPVIFKIKQRKIIRKVICIVTIFSVLYSISMYIYRMYFEEYVYFFNVGQGNMCIVRDKRKVVVFDIGATSKSMASNTLESFLKSKAIYSIDAIFLTHMHEDHVNGLYEISQKFNIKNVIYSLPKTTDKGEYEKFLDVIKKKNIPSLEVIKDDEIKIGDMVINVLMPITNKTIISSDMLNSNSSIYLLKKDENSYLFMGDSTVETEKVFLDEITEDKKEKLKNLKAIQVGHHGSKTSTSKEFLNSINSCIAIISSKKNVYGHPHKDTLDLLKKYNFDIKITEEIGAIKIK